MAVPFRKVSNTRGRKRRTHYKITENATVKCPKCGAEVRPHFKGTWIYSSLCKINRWYSRFRRFKRINE